MVNVMRHIRTYKLDLHLVFNVNMLEKYLVKQFLIFRKKQLYIHYIS